MITHAQQLKKDRATLRRHYGLKHLPAHLPHDGQIGEEIVNLLRKHRAGSLDDSQELLYSALDLDSRYKEARNL